MTRWIWITAIALACALAACGDNTDPLGPQRIIASADRAQLEIGDITHVQARYDGATGDLPGSDIEWTSSDPALATVTGGGASATITALAAGDVTITAAGRGLTAEVALSIAPARIVSIAIAPTQPSAPAGTTTQLTATATYSDDTTADVTAAAVWSSDHQGIATVYAGLVQARARGDATITAKFNNQFFASTRVVVTPPLLASIAVTPDNPMLSPGATQQFTATGTFGDGSTQNITAQVAWTSSAPAVATIASGGLASAVGPGTATITARSGAITGTAQVMVTAASLVSIEITPNAPGVPLSADHPFTATGTFSDMSTGDITQQVTWDSSNQLVATISNTAGSRGVADALGLGSTTITASLGAISDSTTLSVSLAPVGPWLAEAGVPAITACSDGVKFSMASDLVFVCTTAMGVMRGDITGTTVAWSTPATGLTNLQGQAIATHAQSASTMMYMGAPQAGVDNWFRSNDGLTFTPSLLLDSAGNPRSFYAGRFQPMIGNLLGTWDPGAGGTPQAIVLTGQNPPANARVVANATGTVRSFAGSAANNLYAGVLGETPSGGAATGGVFRSTNSGATWTAQDTGIAAADKDRVTSVVIDPTNAQILYAGARGGGRVYKTTDAGATWTASATGMPGKARVLQLLISPQSPSTLFAATHIGLYKSTDAGATWQLVGFQGRSIRGVAQSGATAELIFVAVEDGVGIYRAM